MNPIETVAKQQSAPFFYGLRSTRGKSWQRNDQNHKINMQEASSSSSLSSSEILFECLQARIMKFSIRASMHSHVMPALTPPNSPSSATERMIARGPLRLYKIVAHNSTFLQCGDVVHPILKKLRCWAVSDCQLILPLPTTGSFWRIEIESCDKNNLVLLRRQLSAACQLIVCNRNECSSYQTSPAQWEIQDDKWLPASTKSVPNQSNNNELGSLFSLHRKTGQVLLTPESEISSYFNADDSEDEILDNNSSDESSAISFQDVQDLRNSHAGTSIDTLKTSVSENAKLIMPNTPPAGMSSADTRSQGFKPAFFLQSNHLRDQKKRKPPEKSPGKVHRRVYSISTETEWNDLGYDSNDLACQPFGLSRSYGYEYGPQEISEQSSSNLTNQIQLDIDYSISSTSFFAKVLHFFT
ncbi:inheritance of peroxisomes protein 1-domain-containing protein [Lipomyces japonicus]|uniref:inheritance of peroxisomes protein 1-domain-containing protein n=1 Tax=Lipomyces japonicus TaxID=56871 RepID=UPI0034CEA252